MGTENEDMKKIENMLGVLSTKLVEMDDKLEHILSETKNMKMENAKLKEQKEVDDKDNENAEQTKPEVKTVAEKLGVKLSKEDNNEVKSTKLTGKDPY
ncbi:hypothetical protein FQA39_LY14475 [Lamprigera yunnana]|nr:hypothetical protein FQA39_LY14475 [Lamprigera yunnana]